MIVRVGDLWPGNFVLGEKTYFPELTWSVLEQTFNMLRDAPETVFIKWPLYDVWNRYCIVRFGEIPCGCEETNKGRGWAWPSPAAHFRRIWMSFQKHGYVPAMASGGELFTVVESGGKLCVLQGNKRVCLLRMTKGHAFEIDVIKKPS